MGERPAINRRTVLATLGTTTGGLLAGCVGGDSDGGDTGDDNQTGEDSQGMDTPSGDDTSDDATEEADTESTDSEDTPNEDDSGDDTPDGDGSGDDTPGDGESGDESGDGESDDGYDQTTPWPPEDASVETYTLMEDWGRPLCQEMLGRKGPEDLAAKTTCNFSWDAEVSGVDKECETTPGGDGGGHGGNSEKTICECTVEVTSVTVSLDCTVLMPAWENYDGADQSAQNEWDRFIDKLREHENGHLDIANEHYQKIEATLTDEFEGETNEADAEEGEACTKASDEILDAIGNRFDGLVEEQRQAHENYDDETNYGETQGATLDCSTS